MFESQEASALAGSFLAFSKALVRSRDFKEGALDGTVHGFL